MKNFFKPYFYGVDDGMDVLPKAIAAQLDVRLNTAVRNVTDDGKICFCHIRHQRRRGNDNVV